jgi:hypothetical protein
MRIRREKKHESSDPMGYRRRSAVLFADAAALVVAAPERDTGHVFIEGSRPVTEDQVRQKLVSDGWSGLQVLRRGRIVLAMGSKDGRTEVFAVDVLTGRLHKTDDDDDDD